MVRWILPALLVLGGGLTWSLGQGTGHAVPADKALFIVRVPADAEVMIGNHTTTQRGTERLFYTGVLEAGTYSYDISASWKDAGKDVRLTKQIQFQPGKAVTIDFVQLAAAAKAEPKVEPKKEEPKKVEPKKEDVKKDEPKKVEPKKEDVKKEEPKKVEPKKEDVKKEEPKKVEVKKEESKKVEPKKVDVKKDELIKVEPTKDLPKLEPKKVEIKKDAPKTSEVKSRSFQFTYGGKVTDLPPGKLAKVWIPVPASTSEQEIVTQETKVPGKFTFSKDKLYGNGILFFEATADAKGEVPFQVAYKVKRQEVKTDGKGNLTIKANEDKNVIARFLQPDAKVPVQGKPLELLKTAKVPADTFAAAKVMYDVVNGHMKYSKEGKGWGQGDSVWACDSKFGNCTDFHSLFISMARGNKIPSKFEMGFSVPQARGEGVVGGYHCWAWFMPEGKGWVPVDISEASRFPDMKDYYFGNLTEDRVQFSTGRDITLEPRQSGPALNFFIYPYVEVDGQPYAAEKIQRTFVYKDVH